MFDECQPVVVHGELEQGTFEGNRVEVKHSNEYEAANGDRVDRDAAAAESDTCAASGR
jgi:cytochrome c-type biogenesis protein CcmE